MSEERLRASNLELARVMGMVDVSKVKFTYTSFPTFRDVYLGSDIKTNYFHSFWVGVVMTFVNLPEVFWHMVLLSLFRLFQSFFKVLGSFFLVILIRLYAGLSGRAKGIEVDQDSFNEQLNVGVQKKMDHVLLGLKLAAKPEQIEAPKDGETKS